MIKKFHIIGAGIAGLYFAKLIKQKHWYAETVIYEAAAHAGGRAFSFNDEKTGIILDNATHAILGANREALKLLHAPSFHKKPGFWNQGSLENGLWKFREELSLAMLNTPWKEASQDILKTVARKLFPFTGNKTKCYYSQNSLSQDIINPLIAETDEIIFGKKLTGFEHNGRRISRLHFNDGNIDIGEHEIVISAVDAYNYGKIFAASNFEFNEIINIHYRTSVAITLPGYVKMLGIRGKTVQWLFIHDNAVSATISNAGNIEMGDDELAQKVWGEISEIRGRQSPFVPPYRVLRHKRATLKQDEKNNDRRPDSPRTEYANLFIAGDWTMKNYPCSIEAAALSSRRLAKIF